MEPVCARKSLETDFRLFLLCFVFFPTLTCGVFVFSSVSAPRPPPSRPPSSTLLTHTHTHSHTCSEMSYRIVDVECIGRAKTTQLSLTGMVLWPNMYIYILYIYIIYIYILYIYIIYIYIIYIYCDIPAAHDGAQGLSLQCPATAPTEGVAVQGHCMQVRLHGSRGGVFVGHRPPRDPGGPLQIRSFTSIQMVHTHAPPQRGRWDDDENEVKMKMRWKLLNQDAKRGTQEKRERANTNTTQLARNGQNPGKAREKKRKKEKERRDDGHGPRPAEEGEDRSAWTNLNKAKPKPTSARAGPNLPEGRRTQKHMRKGTHGELVNEMMQPQRMQCPLVRLYGPKSNQPCALWPEVKSTL